jgi:hypothetical protein
MAQRGQVWTASNPIATGSTIVSGNVAPPAAGAAVLFGVLNPVDSGVVLEVIRGCIGAMSGTPGAGSWAYCMTRQDAKITAGPNLVPRNVSTGNPGAIAQAYSQVTLTGSLAFRSVRQFPMWISGAIALTSPGRCVIEEVAGDIQVPPGYMLVLAPPALGTTHVVVASLVWAEVPLLS